MAVVNVGATLWQREQELAAYKAALTTIANEAWPEGVKPKYVAAFVLWGVQCYWCKGFSHPEAWTVGCQCTADEPWEGWEG